jgi:hypothetical protein
VTSDTVKEQTALTTQVKQLTESLKQLQQQQNDVVKTQDTHDDNIKALLKVNSDAAEAKKPFIAIAYGILEKLLWIAAIGVIGWLGVRVSQGR